MTWLDESPSPMLRRSRFLKAVHTDLVKKGGTSTHSAMGKTLWLVIARLEEDRVPYTLSAFPGKGYIVEVKPPEERQ